MRDAIKCLFEIEIDNICLVTLNYHLETKLATCNGSTLQKAKLVRGNGGSDMFDNFIEDCTMSSEIGQ